MNPRARNQEGFLRRFAQDRRGAIAIMYGLLLVPLLGAIGLAVDFGRVMIDRTAAQMAADAAALQAAGTARDMIIASDGGPTATTAGLAEGKRRGDALFKAHAQQANLRSWTVDTVVERTGQNLKATATFTITSQNMLGSLFGAPNFVAKGDAKSASSLPVYSDIYMLLDVSASMGIAATPDEMKSLYNAQVRLKNGGTEQVKCAFACHVIEGTARSETNVQVAARAGIRLRVDALRDAVKSAVDNAYASAVPTYRLALYSFGDTTNGLIKELAKLTKDHATLSAASAGIELTKNTGHAYTSYLNETVDQLSKIVPSSQDGSTEAKAKQFAFIITDGLRNVPMPAVNCTFWYLSCYSAIKPSYCDAMKSKGITVAVIYTTYFPIYANPNNTASGWDGSYNGAIIGTGLKNKIPDELKNCASPNWYFEASEPDAINKTIADLFRQATSAPSLTN